MINGPFVFARTYNPICIVCTKRFESKTPNANLCSEICRTMRRRALGVKSSLKQEEKRKNARN